MPGRYLVGLVVAVVFVLVNLVGVAMAAVRGEGPHAGVHVALLLLGAYLARWLAVRYRAHRVRPGPAADVSDAPPPDALGDRLAHLQQSVDAVAVEVERVGEGQRFITRVVAEAGAPAAGAGASAQPARPHH